MFLPATLILTLGLLAQKPTEPESKDVREARLVLIKAAVAKYRVRSADDPQAVFRLQEEPILRFNNPVGITVDGAIFLWVDADGRPEVALQAFLMKTERWGLDFTSLSKGPLVAENPTKGAWRPSQGLEFKPVPGAPRPDSSAASRLRQMKEIVEGFVVSEDFRVSLDVPPQGWEVLRPMPRHFARFGKAGTSTIDGGLFCYAQGTDPEAFLMLEALDGPGGTEWRYAFAPQTICALKAAWKGAEVWSSPFKQGPTSDQLFYNQAYRELE